ncbi:MAG TPA: hypothetical protein DDY77_06275, partial [Clostridiales bacterium]|nr:hypothetical protein [Clostridiales bacterium]
MTFKHFWKNRKFKVWFCTAVPILVLVTAIVVAFTANAFLYQTLNSVFGGERQVLKSGDASKYVYYKGEYSDKKSVLKAANELNEEIAAEGAVLLKNEDNALPIAKNSKITVFGKNSVNPVLGGSGSNAASAGSGVIGIYDSLKNAGYEVNPEMRKFYEDNSRSGAGRPQSPGMNSTITGLTGFPTGETAVEKIDEKARSSWSAYSDAALVVVSRIGGEGFDLPRTMFWDGKDYQNWTSDTLIDGARKKDDHYLQLDKNETELLKTVAESFDKIIVVINSPTLLECGFLDDSGNYAFSEKIKAALFVGAPGNTGFNALGKILSGEVNPSGRLTDTAARDFKTDPTWNNFGNNLKDGGNRYTDENGSAKNAYFVNYSEGIYTGYRYWETRGFVEGEKEFSGTINNTETSVFDSWYEAHVVYPFGYGLSYTEFSWEVKPAENNAMTADGTLKFEVTVKNEGNTPGKEVVELYYTSPYTQGGIEKAHKVLGGFAKTGVIAPGETEKVTVEVSVRDMASYDYSDANKNGFKGYELESGEYVLRVAKNAREDVKTYSYNLANDIKYETDSATNATIENLFDDVSGRIKTYMSRADFDGTFPALPTAEEYKLSASDLSALNYKLADKETDPWYATKTPSFSSANLTLDQTTVKLYDLIGKDYNDEKWEELLSQLTVADVRKLIESGNYHTEPIECIDKPKTTDPDGPMGYSLFMGDPSVYETCYYSSESLMGCTWNKELMERFGEMIGEESLVGNKKGDGRTYAGWYAPACNLHRSQFSGRNFEYYSEDGVLSSSLTVAVIKGAKKKGVYTYLKHFALNDQETNRDTSGLVVWANEQAMRENYFLPFEKAVKDGGTNAMMSAFNRIGFTWCGGNYTLLTTLLRDEWGFEGMVVTDYNLTAYMNVDQMIRAGGDINLSQSKSLKDVSSATALMAMRKAAKNILFTVANSNAMNGHGSGNVYGYAGPTWFTIMWASFAVVVSAVLTFGVFAVVSAVSGYRAGVKAGVIVVKQPEKQVVLGKKAKIFLPATALVVAAVTVVSAILLSAPAVKPYVPELPAVEQGEITLSLNGSPISGEGVLVNKGSSGDIITVTVNSVGSSVGKVSFSSSNENVLTVSEKGILTAVDTGEAVITVS